MKENEQRKPNFEISDLRFERLSQTYEASAFSCGVTIIDNWFARRSYQDHLDLLCRVATAHLPGVRAPVGYYSMCMATEYESQFDDGHPIRKLKYFWKDRHAIVCKLEWVAVERDFQGRGIGTLLMGKAIEDFADVVDRTGVFALIIQAIDRRVQAFYRHLGFEDYGDPALLKMILPAMSVMDAKRHGLSP
jgi:GNAT superfamily N-acetyltransferase